MTSEKNRQANPTSRILVGLLVVAAFVIGILWTEVKNLKKGTSTTTQAAAGQAAGAQAEDTAPQTPPESADNIPPVTDEDHVKGDRNARIALIEYSDFECPFCKQFHTTAQQVVDNYEGKVMWVYRHFPLAFHANAQKEAEASECAAELGGEDGFWEYTDKIFERTTSNGTGFALEDLVPLAGEIGLAEGKFKECLDSGRYTQEVKDEMDAGAAAGISGTPGNILLETKTGKTNLIPGAVPYEQLKQAIDELLGAS